MYSEESWLVKDLRNKKGNVFTFVDFPSVYVEEISYTTQWQCMSSRARHLCDFDLDAFSH